MRHYMTDPDNEERLLKITPFVVAVIKAEAYTEAREAVANAIPVWDQDGWNVCSHKDALAAIDALRDPVP